MKLKIKDFAAIHQANIEFKGLTVIAGENDTGKSTVGKLIFAMVKAVSRYEQDLEESKEKRVMDLLKSIYFNIRFFDGLTVREQIGENWRDFFRPNIFFEELEEVIRIDAEDKINKIIEKRLDLINQVNGIRSQKRAKARILDGLETLKLELNKNESKTEILKRAFRRALISEFKMEVTPKTTQRKTKVSWSEGEVELFELSIKENKITDFDLYDDILSFDDVTFIENPIILQLFEIVENADTLFDIANIQDKGERIERFGKPKVSLHIKDLMNKLKNAQYFFDDETSKTYQTALNIQKIVSGRFDFSSGDSDFIFSRETTNKKSFNLKSINTASGIKAFGIIQLLLLSGIVDNKSLLVIDEPETHLHPKWQVAYAEIVLELIKNDINVLVTSHSPYFIQALSYFSQKEGLEDRLKFYLAEKHDHVSTNISDVTDDLNQIFIRLSEPLRKLVWQQ